MRNLQRKISLSICIAMILNSTSPAWAVIDEGKSSTPNIEITNSENSNNEDEKSTITWTSSDSVEVGSTFDKMNGVKALDKDGKDITQLVSVEGEVNTEKAGTYTLKYIATSDEGEVITASRDITVIENKSQETINNGVEDAENEVEDTEKSEELKIVGSDTIRTYLGEEFDPKFGISATDANGKDITELITVEGEVKTNELGSYELKYSVTDELGQTATFNRKVQVINKNIFNAYIEKINEETNEKVKELGFSIYLDNKKSKFVVENQSTDKLNPSIKDEIAFKIRVLDKDNKEKLVIDLLGEDTGDSEKLNPLKELEYSYGDFIEIHPKDIKEGFNIEGPILGDIDKEKEDYTDGVDNIDYINNVRFQIVEEGIESVYNNAPEISGLEVMDELLTERDKQLEGVKVIDDHDGEISVDDIQISEEKDDEDNVIGLRYTVSDRWGRSTSAIRLLESAQISLYTTDGSDNTEVKSGNTQGESNNNQSSLSKNTIEIHGINYPDRDTLRFKLKFNQDTRKIEVEDIDGRLFDNKVKDKYFELIIYDKHGNEKEKLTINGSDRSDTDKLSNFKGDFEFDDQIHLYHKYSDTNLKIQGNIEAFGDGNPNNGIAPDKLTTNRFELKQTGLKYLTNQPPTITWENENTIRPITRGKREDLLNDITVKDEIDGEIDRNRVSVTDYNPNQLGEQTVTYTVRDSWGAETTKDRQILIVSNTNLANTSIDVMKVDGSQNNGTPNDGSQPDGSQQTVNLDGESQDTTTGNGEQEEQGEGQEIAPEDGGQGEPNDEAPSNEGQKAFSIKFDNFEKKILVVDRSENKLNEAKPNEVAFRIRVFSKAGITKKDISLNGSDDGSSNKLDELHDFKYTDGDTIQLWSSDPKKGLKIVGNISKDSKITEASYEDGIDDENFMNNVRFELKENILHAKYNTEPSIVFKKDLTIKRGETFDPLRFIEEVKDDHDKINPNLVRASYKKDEVHKVGPHKIEYKVSDKWGRSHSKEITINVLPKNKLEETKIKLFKETAEGSDESNSTNKPILTLHFDDVNKKLVKEIVPDATISGAPNTDVFKISVFDSSNELRAESIIKANEGLNSSSLSEVTELTLEDNDNISITAYRNDKVSIDGDVASNHKSSTGNKKYENGFTDNDKMNNTRFRLTSDGLKELYNEAPKFEGLEDTSILKGDSFNNLHGVSVTDDHDGEIQSSNITVTGEINNQELGPQTLTYKVSDSWGRTTQKIRTVTVKSKAENNEIELVNRSGNTAFKIGFDFVKNKFTLSEQSETAINESNEGNEFFIFIADRDDRYVNSVLLKGTDKGNSGKLKKLTQTNVRTGYKFFVWSNTHSNLKISGDIAKENSIITEVDYSDGIDDPDFMNNVVFKVTEDGLEAMYNQAPVISLKELETNLDRTTPQFTLYKGDDYKKDLLGKVSVTDDRDDFTEEKIQEKMKIKLTKITKESNSDNETESSPESEDSEISAEGETESDSETVGDETGPNSESESNNEFDLDKKSDLEKITTGEYVASYTIKDSWGRVSETKDVNIEIVPAIDRNKIVFGRYEKNAPGRQETETGFKLGFNSNSKRIEISEQSPGRFHSGYDKTAFYTIKVYKNNQSGETTPTTVTPHLTVTLTGSDLGNSNKLESLKDLQFNYGDYIEINALQPFRLKIEEPVRNQLEDYSDYVDYGDDLQHTRFIITEGGLKAEFIPEPLSDDESFIEYIGTEGGTPFKIKFNHADGSVDFPKTTGFYNYHGDIADAFIVNYYDSITGETTEYVSDRRHGEVKPELRKKLQGGFNYGDYLNIELVGIPENFMGVRVSGNIVSGYENYTEKVQGHSDIKNVRFYLGNDGLYPVYNDGPVFKGVEDVNIYVGETFDPHNGVTATDAIDANNTDANNTVDHSNNNCDGHNTNSNTKTSSDNETGENETGCDKHDNNTLCYQVSGEYNNNRIGSYPFTYTSRDSWGRTTTVTRNVHVRPAIFKNRIMLYAKDETTNEGEITTPDEEEATAPESRETTNKSEVAPAFEIGVDNETGKYTVSNQLDKQLNPALDDNVTFRISIYGSDGNERAKVELNGTDTGQSTKLEALKNVAYSGEDYIRLWSAEPKYLRITGPITQESDLTEGESTDGDSDSAESESVSITSEEGEPSSENESSGEEESSSGGENNGSDVENEINGKENYNNGIDNEDKMKNVAFKLTNDEMSTIYNKAPEFKGLKKEIEILFGDEETSLLKDVSISDDKDGNIPISNVKTTGTVNPNEIGDYKVTHTVTDSWGRSKSQEVTYKVVSKMKENSIEVYGSSSNDARDTNSPESNANDKKFTLTFNTDTNKIEVNINNNSSNVETKSSDTPEGSTPKDGAIGEGGTTDENGIQEDGTQEEPKKDFEIVVRNRDTDVKAKVSLNENEMMLDESFKDLKAITLSNGDTISLYNKNESNIKIKGHIENSNGNNFESGFPSGLKFEDVRFKVTNKGLELFNRENLDSITMKDLTMTRGDDSNKYEGIDFGFKNKDSYLGLKIDIQNFDKLKLGKQTATYVFNDSWGHTRTIDRIITVNERNELEKNKIKVLNKDNGKQEILHFEFDTIKNEIIPKIAENQSNNYTETVNELLNIKLYDSEGVTKSNTTVTSSNLNSISAIEYDDGDLISISAYDNENGLSITGKIEGQKESYENGVENEDHIVNVRFEIKESGLKSVYNKAPILNVQNNLTLFKDESPDLYEGISVIDDDEHDKGKIADNTQIETNLDITKIGTYKATYTAIDNWGRKSEPKERTITVKSSLENNKIQYYPPDSPEDSAIDISIDNENNELKVTKNYGTFRKIKKRNASQDSEATEDSGANGDSGNTEETKPKTIFKVELFDENGESKKDFTILSNDDTSSVNKKIKDFNETSYSYGDYISVFAKDNQNGVKIIGNIDKTSKIDEDYSDGIKNIDFMNNVRFRIDEEALEAVYNEAPKMTIPEEIVQVFKGDYHDFVAGVKVSDDHDANLRPSNIIISEEDKNKFNEDELGEKEITLTLRDSWGRQVQGTRKFNVNNSIDRNVINLGGYEKKGDRDVRAFVKIGFDSSTKTLKLNNDRQEKKFHETGESKPFERFYVIDVCNSDGTSKLENGEIVLKASDFATTSKLDVLNNLEFNYGDYITLDGHQRFRYSIEGPVRNGREDYSDRVDLGDDIKYTKFYITDAGLRAHYEPGIELDDDETLIEYVGSEGDIPFRMKLNHTTNDVTLLDTVGTYHWAYGDDIAFKLTWHRKSNGSSDTFEYTGKTGGYKGLKNYVIDTLGGHFGDGDYITFESYDPKMIRIRGNLLHEGSGFTSRNGEKFDGDDLSDGIDKPYLMTQTRFYLNKPPANDTEKPPTESVVDTSKGITVERLGAPTIEGANDIEVLQGSNFSAEENVVAKDFDGKILTEQMTVTGGNIDTRRLGVNEIVYKVTNDNNITDTVIRNVSVYSTATIALKEGSTPYIEQGTSKEEAEKYLKTLVRAQDTEDNNADLNDRVEVDISSVNLEVPGSYPVTYSVKNNFGKTSTLKENITVGRKISVSVPTTLPFQVVTNLINKDQDPFISGVLKIQNNNTSEVDVYVKDFVSKTKSGDLQIVAPNSVDNWDELSEEDSMRKMALGLYVKSGMNGRTPYVKEDPLWLIPNQTNETRIGILPRATNQETPFEAQLSFTSKHGKKFKGGTTKGRFELVFEFK